MSRTIIPRKKRSVLKRDVREGEVSRPSSKGTEEMEGMRRDGKGLTDCIHLTQNTHNIGPSRNIQK